MNFEHRATVNFDLVPQLQWLWNSDQTSSFIVGDERIAYSLPYPSFTDRRTLQAARPFDTSVPFQHPCNLPIPESLYEEFAAEQWRGFNFLKSVAYDNAVDDTGHPVGDLLRTLVFGPDYGHYVRHQPSGMVLGLRSGTIQLLRQSENGFSLLAETRTRGRAALTFAAHPIESLIVYGDNYGNFHAHQFSGNGFGKAKKIAEMERKASALQFIDDGRNLVIGGTGYLSTFSYDDGEFSQLHQISEAVRDFYWVDGPRILFVNQGLHGVTAYRFNNDGFNKIGALKLDLAVQQMAISKCLCYLAVSSQNSPIVNVFEISQP